MTTIRKSYRMYLNETPIGISIYAYSFEESDMESLFFLDEKGFVVCCIGQERVLEVKCDDEVIWSAPVTVLEERA